MLLLPVDSSVHKPDQVIYTQSYETASWHPNRRVNLLGNERKVSTAHL